MKTTLAVCAALLLLVVSACAPRAPTTRPPAAGLPVGFPAAFYAHVPRASLYRVEPELSALTVKVYRSGPLAALGHNHVIEGPINGFIYLADDLTDARADLFVAVADLVVDDATARAAAGPNFATQPSESDILGTRANMLGPKVLDTEAAPFILVHVTPNHVGAETTRVQLSIDVRGHTATTPVDVRWHRDGSALSIRGDFEIDHATLGMEPFSALGGALRVADKIDISVSLVAKTDK
jgi:hypothetical protein